MNAWLSVSSSRNDLVAAGSSSNMLHSIYGSQVSQLPIYEYEESDSDDDEWARICFSTPHLTRPRSAAENLSLQRNELDLVNMTISTEAQNNAIRCLSVQSKLPAASSSIMLLKPQCHNTNMPIRPRTAVVGSVHNQVCVRPRTAVVGSVHNQTRTRPRTAVVGRVHNQTHTRPRTAVHNQMTRKNSFSTVQASNRPKTANPFSSIRDSRSASLKRPRTAHIIRSVTSQGTQVQPVVASLQNASAPVALSSTPQYFDFWNEKPLKPRDWSKKTYPRKQLSKRPKSSYGSLNGHGNLKKNRDQNRNGASTDHDVNGTVHCEDIDGTVDKTGLNTSSDYHNNNNITDDDNCKNGLGNNRLDSDQNGTGNNDEDNKVNDLHLQGGNSGDNSQGGSSHGKNDYYGGKNRNSNEDDEKSKYGVRDVLGGGGWNGVDGDEYFNKINQLEKSSSSTWLDSGGGSSSTTRFNLPIDLRTLEVVIIYYLYYDIEVMMPLDYLKDHCILSNKKKYHYSKIFTALCRHRYMSTRKEVIKGIDHGLYKLLPKEHAEYVCQLVKLPSVNLLIDKAQFGNICAVAERLYGTYLPSGVNRAIIEVVDFEALQWKLRGCKLTEELHTLLFKLSCA